MPFLLLDQDHPTKKLLLLYNNLKSVINLRYISDQAIYPLNRINKKNRDYENKTRVFISYYLVNVVVN